MVARVLVLFLLAGVFTAALGAPPSQAQNIFTVDATGDAGDTRAGDGTCATSGGDCTLRAALEEANATENSGGPDRIEFDIPGSASPGSPHRIEPGSALPNVTDPVVIDGTTEPDYNGDRPVLEIDGGSAGSSNGFVVESGGGLDASGLSVVGFDFDAFELEEGSGPNAIRGCFIGVRADGTTTAGNGDGISVGAEDTAIGGAASSEGNVIAGNAISGITLRTSASSPPTTVRGNAIGLDAEGGPAGNGEDGILIIGSNASVGGTGQGEGNVIAHNGGAGARVTGADEGAHVGNEIRGNRIFSNEAIGIDLGTAGFNNTSGPLEGPTENDEGDGDDGPNRLQNFPKIQKASYDASANEVTVTYQVPSDPDESGEGASAYPLTVDLYRADADEEEGEAYLGTDTYSSVSPDDYAGCGSPPCTAAVTFAPASPASEEDEIVATATDDNGNTGEFSASVPVESPNDPPTAFDDSDETEEGQSTTTDVLANDSDPDGELDPSTVQVQSSPSDGTASANKDGTITYSPDGGFAGTDSYTYTVEDDDGAESGEATVTIEVSEANQVPTLDANDGLALTEGGSAAVTTSELSGSDPDDSASDLTYTVTTGPTQGDLLVEGTQASSFTQADLESGSVEYDHTVSSAEDDSFEFDLTDPSGTGPTGETFQLSVNAVPSVSDDSDQTEEGEPTATDVLANDSDPDGKLDASSVQVEQGPIDGTITGVDGSTGKVTYDPGEGFTGTDSYTYTVEDDDGAESGEATVTIEVNAPPTVSNAALSSDGAGNLDFSFQTDEQLGSDASDIAVSVDGPNTPDVYSFDRTDFSESGSGPYTYALATTQAYDDGAGTYAVSVDDAVDPDGADGADGTQTGSYTLDAEVSLKDGNDGEPYVPPSTTPGTNANPVGRFRLSADVSGGVLSSLTVAQEGAAPSGVDAIELWESEDDTFESGNDLEIASKSYANSVSFSGVSVPIPTGGTYLFIVVDLASDADGDYRPKITEESDIEFEKGELSNVNGTETTNFTDAFLSSEATALPVELVSFDAVTSEHGVVLTWRTASEQKNAGFHVQREKRDGASEWTTIGRREGAGTTAEPQTYRFTDSALPYEADQLFYRLRQVDADGSASYSKTLTVERSVGEVKLLPTRPNPAGDWATVRYAVPEAREVSVRLYDAMGQQVRTVTDGTQKGRHTHRINVTDLASGTYFLRLQAGTQIQTQKLTVLQ